MSTPRELLGIRDDLAKKVAERQLDRQDAVAAEPVNGIGSMTLSETGWTRLDNQTMRWISEPIAEGAGRHALQLKGYGRGLGIAAAWLPPDVDPDDAEDVADELDDAWPAVLPLPALIVLRTALDTVIAATEAAQ